MHSGKINVIISEQSTHRFEQARAQLVAALREYGELADAVETFEGSELLEVLEYLDSLRFRMIEAQLALQGIVRGEN